MADEKLPWEVTFEDSPDGKFTKRNPRMYRALIDQLVKTINPQTGKSQIATVTAVTGDWVVVNKKRRGTQEREEERAFRDAAAERGTGIRIDPTHLGNGRTDLRIQLKPRKEFPPEVVAQRKEALAKARELKKAEAEHEAQVQARLKAQAPTKKQ